MIVVSSIKVNGEFTSNRPFTCTDPVRPADAYARSKLAAEERLWAVCGSSSLEGVVVRPPLIYGPGVKANFSRLVQTVQRGVPLPLGAVRNKRSLLNLWNLAAFLQLAIVHPAAGGKVWLVSDDEDLSTAELVARIGAALGRPARLLNVPVSLLELLARITGRVEEFRRLTQSLRIDCAAAKTELGYAPILGVQSAIERTVRAMCLKGASDVA